MGLLHRRDHVPSAVLHRQTGRVLRQSNDPPWHWVLGALCTALALFALGAWLDEHDAARERAAGLHAAQLQQAHEAGRLQGRADVDATAAALGCSIFSAH